MPDLFLRSSHPPNTAIKTIPNSTPRAGITTFVQFKDAVTQSYKCCKLIDRTTFRNCPVRVPSCYCNMERVYVCCYLMTLSIAKITHITVLMNKYGEAVEWYWQGKTEIVGEKPVPVLPLCSPQTPNGLGRNWRRSSAVTGRRLPVCHGTDSCVLLSNIISDVSESSIFNSTILNHLQKKMTQKLSCINSHLLKMARKTPIASWRQEQGGIKENRKINCMPVFTSELVKRYKW